MTYTYQNKNYLFIRIIKYTFLYKFRSGDSHNNIDQMNVVLHYDNCSGAGLSDKNCIYNIQLIGN